MPKLGDLHFYFCEESNYEISIITECHTGSLFIIEKDSGSEKAGDGIDGTGQLGTGHPERDHLKFKRNFIT